MINLVALGCRTERVLFMVAGLLLVSGCNPFSDKAELFDAAGKPVGPVLRSDPATTPIVRFRTADDTAALRVWQADLVAEGMWPRFLDALSVVASGSLSTPLSSGVYCFGSSRREREVLRALLVDRLTLTPVITAGTSGYAARVSTQTVPTAHLMFIRPLGQLYK